MTEISDDMLIRHEREFGDINARIRSLETGRGEDRSAFKEALNSIKDETSRQSMHLHGEVRDLESNLNRRLDKVEEVVGNRLDALDEAFSNAMERQREEQQRRDRDLIDSLDATAKKSRGLNRGVILGIGALLLGAEKLLEVIGPSVLHAAGLP